jgi:uncharacterized cupredoxin-like copper-binding protein
MQRIATVSLLVTVMLACGTAIPAEYAGHDASSHARKTPKKKGSAAQEKPFGREGDPRKVKRTIRVDMSDTMRYFPSEIRVKRGDTVRFAARNNGQVPHEMVLGTMDDLKKHAERMKTRPDEMSHDEPYVAHAEPGATGRLVWQFTRAGEFYYGCLVPGHFEAGMIGTIVVR